jgi:hypothetical protein
VTGGAPFEQILAFYEGGSAPVRDARTRIRGAVLVKVERALPLDSPVDDLGVTEEAVRDQWCSHHCRLAGRDGPAGLVSE